MTRGARPLVERLRVMRSLCALAFIVALSCCATAPASPQDEFFARLTTLCGQAFAGHLVSADAADAGFASQPLAMHVRECGAREIRIPFHVGENRSRTWVISRTPSGLRLKHDHRHENGDEDALTQYGGDTAGAGSPMRQDFPADAASQALFRANNIPASVENVWALEIQPGAMFAYELQRPNRHFRVEFNLREPVSAPPPPWGQP